MREKGRCKTYTLKNKKNRDKCDGNLSRKRYVVRQLLFHPERESYEDSDEDDSDDEVREDRWKVVSD